MRFNGLLLSLLILSACNSTQTVYVEAVATQASNSSLETTPKIDKSDSSKSPTPKAPIVPKHKTEIEDKNENHKAKNQTDLVLPNPKDLAAVTQYCEKRAQQAVYITLKCKTDYEQNICITTKKGEKLYLSEVENCHSQFGWNAY